MKTKKSIKENKEQKQKPKKKKSDQYIMKKNAGMKVLRIIFWIMIIFIFIRGVVTIFEPDKEDTVSQMITDFKENYSDFTNQNNEIMSFAQNFAKEYLTYSYRDEEDYKKRLEKYVASNFLNSNIVDFTASATVVYAQAYRIEDYSANQKDVFVQVEIEYVNRILESDQSYTEESERMQCILKVPIYCKDGAYVVESIPQIVADDVGLNEYLSEEYYGTSIADDKAKEIKKSVENFLKAYLEQDKSVINYYLDNNADKNAFMGLQGRFTFEKIADIKCYEGMDGIICLVEYQIKDTGNDVALIQKINLVMQESGGRYYIKSMNTRTGNLNIN